MTDLRADVATAAARLEEGVCDHELPASASPGRGEGNRQLQALKGHERLRDMSTGSRGKARLPVLARPRSRKRREEARPG